MTNPNEKTFALFSNPINKKIVAELEKNNAKVFRFPMPEIKKLAPDETSIGVLKNLDAIDWIIFPDVLTVDFFLETLQANEIDLFEMDSVQVCALGEAVADRLRFVQLHADVIPTSLDAANVFIALSDFIGKGELSNLRFLLPKEVSREYEIKEKLVRCGANVVELPIYQAMISRDWEIAKLKVLLQSGAIDEFIISSPIDLVALEIYFNRESTAETLSKLNISAVDKLVFQTLREHELKAVYFRLETKKG